MEENNTIKKSAPKKVVKKVTVKKKAVSKKSVKDRWIDAMVMLKHAKSDLERQKAIKSLQELKKEILK